MRNTTRNVAALVLMGLASCDSATGPQSEQGLWQALGIVNYDFVYQVECFCSVEGPNPALVSVRNGDVTTVAPVDTAVTQTVPVVPSSYPTVDSLFATLERAQKAAPAVFTVQYDPTYHYPSHAVIDPNAKFTDDEIAFEVLKFTPVIVPGSG